MHSDPASLKNIVSKVLTWLIRTRWRRAIWGTLSVIKCKLSFQPTRFSPFCYWKPIAQRCFCRTMSANVFLYLRLNWVIEILLVMDLKRVVLCYFSDEEDCFPSRSHHSNSENGQNVPGRVSPQTAVGTLLYCEFYIPWWAFLIVICNLKHEVQQGGSKVLFLRQNNAVGPFTKYVRRKAYIRSSYCTPAVLAQSNHS